MRLSDLLDAAAVAAVSAGLGLHFGWWISITTAGVAVILSNWVRAK